MYDYTYDIVGGLYTTFKTSVLHEMSEKRYKITSSKLQDDRFELLYESTIGDGSCFLHAVLQAVSTTYRNSDSGGRRKMTNAFRFHDAREICELDEIQTIDEQLGQTISDMENPEEDFDIHKQSSFDGILEKLESRDLPYLDAPHQKFILRYFGIGCILIHFERGKPDGNYSIHTIYENRPVIFMKYDYQNHFSHMCIRDKWDSNLLYHYMFWDTPVANHFKKYLQSRSIIHFKDISQYTDPMEEIRYTVRKMLNVFNSKIDGDLLNTPVEILEYHLQRIGKKKRERIMDKYPVHMRRLRIVLEQIGEDLGSSLNFDRSLDSRGQPYSTDEDRDRMYREIVNDIYATDDTPIRIEMTNKLNSSLLKRLGFA